MFVRRETINNGRYTEWSARAKCNTCGDELTVGGTCSPSAIITQELPEHALRNEGWKTPGSNVHTCTRH